MGYPLYREVLDHAPATLTPAERLVLAVLADYANDKTREAHPGMPALCRRCGMSASGIGKALRRLADRGLDVRVAVGKDSRGRLVYAYEGAASRYRIPEWSPQRATTEDEEVTPAGDHVVASAGDHSDSSGRPLVPEWSPAGPSVVAPPGDPSPQGTLNEPSAAAHATEIDDAAVLAEVRRRKPDASDSLVAYIARQDATKIRADLRVRLERAAARQEKAATKKAIAAAAEGPRCEHLVPGGNQLHPTTGEPLCPLCRIQARRSA